ncbi:MAG: cytochrome C oxidase subunit IV family protein [Acidobacteriota bacterium]
MSEHIVSKHIVPIRVYLAIFGILMVLTGATVFAAYFDLEHIWGPLNAIVAMSIALLKATLVVLYFMHVRYSSRLTQVIVFAGIFWFVIMIVFMMTDYLTRSGWPAR